MMITSRKKALQKTQKKEHLQEHTLVNISKTTSEKIEEKYLKAFLKTNIEDSKKLITSKSKTFYTYFKDSNLYEIYFIENYSNKNICLPFLFYELHDKKNCELFISENFFTVFQNGEFKIFKEIENKVSTEEILEFLLKRYKISINKVHKIDTSDIKNLKQKYISNKSKPQTKLISLKNDNSQIRLFSFIGVILLIPLIHFNFFNEKEKSSKIIERKISTLEKKYNSLLDKNYSKKSEVIIDTLVQIKNSTLNIKSVTLKKDKLFIFLESANKSKLINFVDGYKGNIKINKLTFNQQNKKFDLEALIVI